MKTLRFSQSLSLLVALLLSACGGGETGTGGAPPDQQQTVIGTITGFGSVFVNGIEFETDEATLSIDGVDASEQDLSVGMVVRVRGTVNAGKTGGKAAQLNAEHVVKGVITDLSNVGSGIVVAMGQEITITADTEFKSFDPAIKSAADFVVNNTVVEVSGFTAGEGQLTATLVKVIANNGISGKVRIKGVISSVAVGQSGFVIGGLNIIIDSVTTKFDHLKQSDLVSGLLVHVESEQGFDSSQPNTILASKVELENVEDKTEGNELRLEGVVISIANLDSLNRFEIAGHTIEIIDATRFSSGANKNDIVPGVRVEVEGKVNAGGILIADEVNIRRESKLTLQSRMQNVNANVDLQNKTITLMEQLVFVTQVTRFEDESDNELRKFKLEDVGESDYISVKCYRDTEGNLIATSIERDEPEAMTNDVIKAVVNSVDIIGRTLTLDGLPGIIVNVSDTGINLDGISEGVVVEVTGSYGAGVLVASSVRKD
jgi:hypothetical protein